MTFCITKHICLVISRKYPRKDKYSDIVPTLTEKIIDFGYIPSLLIFCYICDAILIC